MPADRLEFEDVNYLDQNGAEQLEEHDDLEDAGVAEEAPEAQEEPEALTEVEEESDQASLEELLAQRALARRGTDDSDEDSDIMALSSESQAAATQRSPLRVAPVRARQEFVCTRCHLVKPRVQLTDPERGVCRDCA